MFPFAPSTSRPSGRTRWDVRAPASSSANQTPEIGATSSHPSSLSPMDVLGGLASSISSMSSSIAPSSSSLSSSSASSTPLVYPMSMLSAPSPTIPYSSQSSSSLSPSTSSSPSATAPSRMSANEMLMSRYPGAAAREEEAAGYDPEFVYQDGPMKGKPKKTGSTYTVFSDRNGNVLLGRKNNHAQWLGSENKEIPIINNPGQHVLSGGGVEGMAFNDENIIKNAFKEMTEEFGFDPDLKNNKIMLNHSNGQSDLIATMLGAPTIIRPSDSRGGYPYAAVHVPVDSLEGMMKNFDEMRQVDNLYHGARQHARKYRKDDEINNLYSMPIARAKSVLEGHKTDKSKAAAYSDKRPFLNTFTGRPVYTKPNVDWFINILNEIDKGSSSSSSSSTSK